jgi:hypothetical protein
MNYFKRFNLVSFIGILAAVLSLMVVASDAYAAPTVLHVVNNVGQLETALATAEGNGKEDDIVLKGGMYILTSSLDITITDGEPVLIRKAPKSKTDVVLDGVNLYRVFTINSGQVEMRKLIITRGNATSGGGGGIFVDGSDVNLTLVGCKIDDNHASAASGDGGGILNIDGTIDIAGCTISNNTADDDGGGIRSQGNSAVVDIRNGSLIDHNTASEGGGIVNGFGEPSGDTSTMTIRESTISNNEADGSAGDEGEGGGIFNWSDASLTIQGSTIIKKNKSLEDGGGVHNQGGSVNILNSTIDDNDAGDDAGGLNNEDGTVTITASVIMNNESGLSTADGGGGGICNDFGTMTISNTLIKGNNSTYKGGGISNLDDLTLTNDTRVFENTAADDGGGIYNEYTLVINNSVIKNNTTGEEGGGIFNDGFRGKMDILNDSSISLNIAPTLGDGGGIFNGADIGDLTCDATTVNKNNVHEDCAPLANCPANCQ